MYTVNQYHSFKPSCKVQTLTKVRHTNHPLHNATNTTKLVFHTSVRKNCGKSAEKPHGQTAY